MKRVISISLSLLMLTALFHFSVATHYCHGHAEASIVSLSGKLASCGMEGENGDNPVKGNIIKSHCCDDVVSYYGIDSNYTPSFTTVPEFYQYNFQVFSLPNSLPVINISLLKSLYANVSPPGALMSTSVDISDICVFRI